MFDSYIQLTKSQYDATFWMLNDILTKCEERFWNKPVANLTFDQAAFHALFFTDLYLGKGVDEQKAQAYHQENLDYFRDYEELAGRMQKLHYDRKTTIEYLQFCRQKAQQVLSAETEITLEKRCQISWLDMKQVELHLYNLKHLHHHVAQLSLRLRLNQGEGAAWTNSGWKD